MRTMHGAAVIIVVGSVDWTALRVDLVDWDVSRGCRRPAPHLLSVVVSGIGAQLRSRRVCIALLIACIRIDDTNTLYQLRIDHVSTTYPTCINHVSGACSQCTS